MLAKIAVSVAGLLLIVFVNWVFFFSRRERIAPQSPQEKKNKT